VKGLDSCQSSSFDPFNFMVNANLECANTQAKGR